MRRIKVGILGAGGIFGAHAPGFRRCSELCEVVAIADPRAERLPGIKNYLGDQVCIYKDYHEVMAIKEIEAVDILLPHDLHLPATVAAAHAGKHVLVEKVMARDTLECDEMIAVCNKYSVSLHVAHDRRYQPGWLALKQVVDSGALGEILFWRMDHNQDVVPPAGTWIASSERVGGGAIMSCLTHQIDALRWYAGEFESVQCMTKVVGKRMEGETFGLLNAQLRSGALAQLSINWFTRCSNLKDGLWYEMVHVCGTKGEAYFMSNRGTFVTTHGAQQQSKGPALYESPFQDGKQRFVEVPSGELPGHQKCIEEWLKHLLGQPSQLSTTGEDCRKTVEVAEAAYLSVTEKRTIDLPLQPAYANDRELR